MINGCPGIFYLITPSTAAARKPMWISCWASPKSATSFVCDLARRLNVICPGYRFDVSCQGSVPESFISFLESADFQGAVRNAVSLGEDADTMACIAGDIAQAYFGAVPEFITGEVGRACRTDSWTCSTASSLGSFAGSAQTLLVSGFARARCADRGPRPRLPGGLLLQGMGRSNAGAPSTAWTGRKTSNGNL